MAYQDEWIDAADLRGSITIAVLIVFALALKVAAARFLGDLGLLFSHRGALSNTGGLVAGLLSRPGIWFHPIDQAPFVSTVYPPVFLVIGYVMQTVTGGDPFLVGRAIGLGANIGATALIAVLAYRGRQAPALVAASLYFFSPLVSTIPVQLHVDGLAAAVGLAAVYWFRRDGRWTIAGAAVLCVLAVYTKQNLVVVPAAVGLALVIDRQWRGAIRFGTMVAVLGFGVLGGLQVVTPGDVVGHLILHSTAFKWYVTEAVSLTGWVLLGHIVIVGFAIAGTMTVTSRDARESVLPIMALLAFELAVITSGKEGAWGGYFLPAWAAATVLAGWFLADHWPTLAACRGRVNWRRAAVGAIVVLLAAGQIGLHLSWHSTGPFDRSAQQDVAAHVADADGPVLSGEAGIVVMNGQREVYDPLMMQALAQAGVWDAEQLTERIERHKYAYIVMRADVRESAAWRDSRWTEGMVRTIREHYALQSQRGGYFVYVPRPAGGAHQVSGRPAVPRFLRPSPGR